MKQKIASLAAAFCLLATVGNAQWAVGLSGGLNMATQKFPSPLTYEPIPLWRAGVHLERKFGKRFSAGLELAYVEKGSRSNDSYTIPIDSFGQVFSGKVTYCAVNRYLNLSFLMKYRLLTGKTRPYVLAGGSRGTLKSATSNYSIGLFGGNTSEYSDELDLNYFNRTEYSLLGGAGVEMDLGNSSHLFAEARYEHGMSNIYDASYGGQGLSRNFALIVGCAFRFDTNIEIKMKI